jgi:hypothetical protein
MRKESGMEISIKRIIRFQIMIIWIKIVIRKILLKIDIKVSYDFQTSIGLKEIRSCVAILSDLIREEQSIFSIT